MPRKFITREDVAKNVVDGVLKIGANDVITAAAEEIAGRRKIDIVREGSAGPSAGPPALPRPAISAPSQISRESAEKPGNYAIVAAVGCNRTHVLAEITHRLAELNANILDISQTIVREYFSLLMITDISGVAGDFKSFKTSLEQLSSAGDYQLTIQHEAVFRAMHRI
jgi:ACT domain-containing protein